MADIRIKDLPPEAVPVSSEKLAIDGSSTRSATIAAIVEVGRPTASQAEAEAGTQPYKAMTPLTTAQAIEALAVPFSAIGSTIQPFSPNLTELAAVDPGTAGKAVLALEASPDIRNFLKLPTLVADRTEMKALDTTKDTVAYLTQAGGHAGAFKWTAGNFSTHIAFDTQEGFYVKANAIAATAGAWVRQSNFITPRMFGALADGFADDNVALQKAWDFSGNYKIPCYMEGLEYNTSDSVFTSSNLVLHGQGAVIYPIAWPSVGGVINNIRPVELERIQSNINIDHLITDGSKLPHYFVERAFPIQASNLLASQSDFSNAAWTKTGVTVTADAGTAPDGTLTADIIRENSANSIHGVAGTTTGAVANGDMLVYCVYAKTSTINRNIAVVISGTAFGASVSTAKFNLSGNSIISNSTDLYVVEVQKVNLSYSLITVAKRATAAGNYVCNVRMIDNTAAETYTGDGASFAVVWGAFTNIAEASNNSNLGPEFGGGASNIRVVNCIARKCRVGVGGGSGGGGFGGELGLKNVQFIGCTAEDCFRGFRIAGNGVDTLPYGATEEASNVVFLNSTARRCGTAVFAHSVAHLGDDESNLLAFDAIFDGIFIENCGHNAWSPVDWVLRDTVGGPQKSGVIALGGAQNVRFQNLRMALSSTYTTTDFDWLGRSGYPSATWNAGVDGYYGAGLSGKVESAIGGWGQNIHFTDVELDGTVTNIYKVHRVNPLGDVGTLPPTGPSNETVRQFIIEKFRHVRGSLLDYAFDAQIAMVGAPPVPTFVVDSRMSVRMLDVTTLGAFVSGVVGAGATALNNVYIHFSNNTGVTSDGTTAEWNTFGNVVPTTSARLLSLGGFDYAGGYSSTGTRFGVSYSKTDGLMRTSQNAATQKFHYAFYNTNGLVGSIQTLNSGTSFATTSDETLKEFIGQFPWEEAKRIILGDPVRDWHWKSDGSYAVGWGAQTSHAVSPDLATVGGWKDPITLETWEEGGVRYIHPATLSPWEHEELEVDEVTHNGRELVKAQKVEAIYMPWGVDQSKRTPYLWVAVSHLIGEVEELKAQLKKKRG